jgi:flagellar hook-length control protein FliK
MNPQSIQLALIVAKLMVNANQASPGHETKDSNHDGKFSGLLKQALQPGKDLRLSGGKKETKPGGAGLSWLERFRNRLRSFGIPLKEMSLSREALPDLKRILIAEGYSESEVTGFLQKLLNGKLGHEIRLTELFERLSEMKALSDKNSSDPVLEMSAIPYLEASLYRLGLDPQEVNRAMERATTEGGQLNLKSLVRNLKGILKALPQANQPGADGKAAEDIKGMLTRVGIIDEASNTEGPMSLERFVRILEQRVAGLTPRSPSETQIENHVNGLVDNVLVPKKEPGGKSSVESLYANKLKALSDNDSKGNRPLKEIAEGLKNSASQEKRAGAGTEKLIEAIQGARGRKAVDQDKVTSPHWVREAIMDRGHAPDAINRQGTRPFPLYVVNQVARQISLSLQRGDNRLRLQLRPPQLGALQIDMDMKGSVLKIGMTTENNSVKEFLVSSIQELRDSLVQQGVKLERLDVQVNYNLGQSMAQARRGQNGFQRQRQGQRGGLDEAAGNRDLSEATTHRFIRADALVDLVA